MESSVPLVSIVIPNLNGMVYLPDCLSSIQNQTYKKFEVIVVDNASNDGSVEFIKTSFPRTIIIENRENKGFAKANNQGIAVAKGDYIATLNNDTKADRDWLLHLISAAVASDASVGMWAPKILSLNPPHLIDSVGGLLLYRDGIAKGRGRLEEDKGQNDGLSHILFPSACSALYRKKMLDEIGCFDEDFFAYCEDNDLGLRARRAGWKALSTPQAVVYHVYSGTGGEYSSKKAFLVERNHLWVAWKNFPVSWIFALPFYIVMRYVIQLYGTAAGKGSAAKFKESHSFLDIVSTLIRAYASAFRGLPSIMKKRREMKRTISETEYRRILKKHTISAKKISLID
ncbi:MAG: glycosyltransferase family 2 protein [Nitrospirae bacterium]|nr:glycosyltransferase family 2 protein [Nitrospirota bacterium]